MSNWALENAKYHAKTMYESKLIGGRIVSTAIDEEEGIFGIIIQPKGTRSAAKRQIVWFSRDAEGNGPGAPILQAMSDG